MFARTKRLMLRPGWIEDAPALAAAIDSKSANYFFGMPLARGDEAGAARLLAQSGGSMPDLLVTLPERETQAVIGGVALKPLGKGGAELRCWISPEERRMGFASEACRAIVEIALHALGLSCLIAVPPPEEDIPVGLLARLDFTSMGGVVRCDADAGIGNAAALFRRILAAKRPRITPLAA